MARWDSPLFTVGWDDPEPPYDDLWLAVTSAVKKKANPSVVPVSTMTLTDVHRRQPDSDRLTPRLSAPPPCFCRSRSLQNGQTAPDTIQTLHSATSTLIRLLLSHLSMSPLSPHLSLPSPPYPAQGLRLPQRPITLSEMQRLKRQFESIQMNGFKRGGEGVKRAGWGEAEWCEAWVRFLEGQWATGDGAE